MKQQAQVSVSITEFMNAEAWLNATPNAFFPTLASLHWDIKKHRDEYIKAGVLIPGRGRAPHKLHKTFGEVVAQVHRREALQGK